MSTFDLNDGFLRLSVELTGFSAFDLHATGQVNLYFDTVCQQIGDRTFEQLLTSYVTHGLSSILDSEALSPICRSIIKLWFTATWEPLVSENLAVGNQQAFIVDPYAYPEGLVWKAIGVNPPAAKAPGYASWIYPPEDV